VGNPELIRMFLTYLRTGPGLSENTIAAYETDLWQFADRFDKPLTKIKRVEVEKYIGELLRAMGSAAARLRARSQPFAAFTNSFCWTALSP
jgi:site-specific recombinase XerD